MIDGFIVSRHLDHKAGYATHLAVLKSIADGNTKVSVPFQAMFTIADEIGIGGTHGFGPEVEELLAIDKADRSEPDVAR